MKAGFVLLAGAWCLCSVSAFGAADTIIRERAKELRNQNNVRQGVAPPATPAPAQAVPGAAAQAAPAQSPALVRLQTDLAALQSGATATPVQKQRLAQDLIAVAQGAAKPALETATKLSEHVASAFAEKPLSAASRARLVLDLDAVLNPGKYPQAKLDGIVADVQAIFQENGLKRNKAVEIAEAVKALAAEVRK